MSWREHGGKPSHLLDMSHRTTFRSAETPCRTTRIPSSPVSVAMGSITRAGRKEHHGRIIHHIRAHEHTPPEFGIDAATVQWLTTGYMLLLVAIGLASLIMAVSFFSEWNGDWLVWALLVVCVTALAGFARMQLKISHPLTGIFRRSPPWPMHLYPSNGLPPS